MKERVGRRSAFREEYLNHILIGKAGGQEIVKQLSLCPLIGNSPIRGSSFLHRDGFNANPDALNCVEVRGRKYGTNN